MRNHTVPALILATTMLVGLPAFAQTTSSDASGVATEAAGDAKATGVIVVPEGFTVQPLNVFTADELKTVKIYDVDGNDLGDVQDIVVGSDNAVIGAVGNFGGYLGLSEQHLVTLDANQIHLYRNANNEIRAFVTLGKDELKALPVYTKP